MSKFRDSLSANKFTVTAEIGPPKGTDIKEMLEKFEIIKNKVAALNVTDNQSSVMRLSSLGTCIIIRQHGGETIFQMTCRDRNRIALQADLLAAHCLGIRDVLILTGDHVALGDHPDAKPVFDLDSVQLLQTVASLNAGKDLAGNTLNAPTDIFPGAAVTPEADPIEPQMIKFEKKVEAGAKFFQTQAIYDIGKFEAFYKRASSFNVPILAGIVLLKSPSMAAHLNKNVPGISVPDEIIHEMDSVEKQDRPQKSIEIAARIIHQCKNVSEGVHIMALGWEKYIPAILDQAEL